MNNFKLIVEESTKMVLEEYSSISIEFKVESEYKLKLYNNGLGGVKFEEESVSPYWKDYDSEDDNPSLLIDKFNLSNWSIVSAFDGEKRIGGAIIAYDTEGINMLEGKDDLSVIWDIRIDKEYRGKGIGSKIINRCVEWAKSKECTRVKIETQNNNVGACKFYVSQGAKLSNFNRYYYKDHPDEVQLIWSINLEY